MLFLTVQESKRDRAIQDTKTTVSNWATLLELPDFIESLQMQVREENSPYLSIDLVILSVYQMPGDSEMFMLKQLERTGVKVLLSELSWSQRR
jgi:hypothetical protein